MESLFLLVYYGFFLVVFTIFFVCYSNALFGEPPIKDTQTEFSKPKPDVWEERALWIFVGMFIVIGILFLSKTSSQENEDQDPYDGSSRSAYP